MAIVSPVDSPTATRERPEVQRRPLLPMPKFMGTGTPLEVLREDASLSRTQRFAWKRWYHRRVLLVDSVVIVAAVVIAGLSRFGFHLTGTSEPPISWARVISVAVILVVTWLIALEVRQSRDISLVGIGAEEYGRVVSATLGVFGLFAVGGLLLNADMSRIFLGVALVGGLAGLVIGRHLLRKYLARRRKLGEFTTRVVVLGKPDSVQMLCDSFQRSSGAGYRVVGVCVPDFAGEVGDDLATRAGAVPILGDQTMVVSALELTSADAVAVTAVEHLGHKAMKKLMWQLESAGTELIMVPGVTDIAGPRLVMRPIDDLPLVHIAPARSDVPSAIAKRAFDICFGLLALLFAIPVMALAACAIKLDDGGSIFFRQVRVGQHGRHFRIFKLRTMATLGVDHPEVVVRSSDVSNVFHKSASDSPRVTRVGRFLRASSIDELPQLLNVLGGSMSMVGPRPLVPGEGAGVEDFVERRSLVKPGITGLWQISGRSDLPEDERIRLDHSYVDNWSCVQDLLIVWRTVRAVLKREGAY